MVLAFQKKQLERFEKDLLIIMEAGYACHAPGVLPDDELRTPCLLTNNMQLMKKIIWKTEARQALDDAIDTLGLERLIPVEFLEEAMDDWEQSLFRRDDVDFEVSPSNLFSKYHQKKCLVELDLGDRGDHFLCFCLSFSIQLQTSYAYIAASAIGLRGNRQLT